MIDVADELKDESVPSFIVHTLGRFNVIKNGRSLVMSSAGSKKIWELYKFMLTHRVRAFTPESLMDQLWISEDYTDLRSTLRRQMHRLRQALQEEGGREGETTLLFSNGYYRWNDSLGVQLDTDLFEGYIKHGDANRNVSPENALKAYRQALDLYHGDYLPECAEQHWIFPVRNHFRRIYIRTVLNVIELLKGQDTYEEILPLCQKAIQIDIYEESFHLSLMDALLSQGELKQALEHYEYITGFYYREMGIKPSAEMRAIYKRLLKSHASIHSEENLLEVLEFGATLDNAFYCEPDVFKSIYELERRRSQRGNSCFSIGVLTAKPMGGYSQSQEQLRISHLKQHLMERLRQGDTFTRWNDQQFVVLLPGVDAVLTEKVLKRVLDGGIDQNSITINQIAHLTAASPHERLF